MAGDPDRRARRRQARRPRLAAAEDRQADSAGVRRPGAHLRQVRPDHRVQPGRVRRAAEPGVPQPPRPRPPCGLRRRAQTVPGGPRRRAGEPVQVLRRETVRLGVDRPGALRDAAHRRGGRGQDPAAGNPPPGGRRPADPQAGRAASRVREAGSAAVCPGRRRRLRRQPGRGAGLPAGGPVDGCVGRAHARLPAGQEHQGAAGVLGSDQ